MAASFDQVVASSPRLVRKQWNSPDELAQELYAILSSTSVSGGKKKISSFLNPKYPDVVTEKKQSYPDTINRGYGAVNFGLENPTTVTYPEVPPIPVLYGQQYLEGNTSTVPTTGSSGSTGSYVKYGTVESTNTPESADEMDRQNPGTVNIKVNLSNGNEALIKRVKVLNASQDFYAPVGAETIVFYDKYAIFPVWM